MRSFLLASVSAIAIALVGHFGMAFAQSTLGEPSSATVMGGTAPATPSTVPTVPGGPSTSPAVPGASLSTPSASLASPPNAGAALSPGSSSTPGLAGATTASAGGTSLSSDLSQLDVRSRLTSAGLSDISGLTQDPNGIWHGTAVRDGRQVAVSVDSSGNVSQQ